MTDRDFLVFVIHAVGTYALLRLGYSRGYRNGKQDAYRWPDEMNPIIEKPVKPKAPIGFIHPEIKA